MSDAAPNGLSVCLFVDITTRPAFFHIKSTFHLLTLASPIACASRLHVRVESRTSSLVYTRRASWPDAMSESDDGDGGPHSTTTTVVSNMRLHFRTCDPSTATTPDSPTHRPTNQTADRQTATLESFIVIASQFFGSAWWRLATATGDQRRRRRRPPATRGLYASRRGNRRVSTHERQCRDGDGAAPSAALQSSGGRRGGGGTGCCCCRDDRAIGQLSDWATGCDALAGVVVAADGTKKGLVVARGRLLDCAAGDDDAAAARPNFFFFLPSSCSSFCVYFSLLHEAAASARVCSTR